MNQESEYGENEEYEAGASDGWFSDAFLPGRQAKDPLIVAVFIGHATQYEGFKHHPKGLVSVLSADIDRAIPEQIEMVIGAMLSDISYEVGQIICATPRRKWCIPKKRRT